MAYIRRCEDSIRFLKSLNKEGIEVYVKFVKNIKHKKYAKAQKAKKEAEAKEAKARASNTKTT